MSPMDSNETMPPVDTPAPVETEPPFGGNVTIAPVTSPPQSSITEAPVGTIDISPPSNVTQAPIETPPPVGP
eukprot:CAMPEP_0117079488 /NCGR_PEP_ID=MMETSP0472-20121206/56090_1 /TAXON_ID=693140 ORGANISM="Tiarina fusus, Strain LIS" /NCGR_SAMPLE_ID=MMETSP0472 /ASSEMBLY_ACC=CAM_ASM_000603 /LENGTH=71 /DNA_ID=CAMNT_0004806751 /DNA_START=31 /DNA_END=243 /DNA_ORIENTATION=-